MFPCGHNGMGGGDTDGNWDCWTCGDSGNIKTDLCCQPHYHTHKKPNIASTLDKSETTSGTDTTNA